MYVCKTNYRYTVSRFHDFTVIKVPYREETISAILTFYKPTNLTTPTVMTALQFVLFIIVAVNAAFATNYCDPELCRGSHHVACGNHGVSVL